MSHIQKLAEAEEDHRRKMRESIRQMEQGQVHDFEEVSAELFAKFFPRKK